jgi:hypothetical protein
MNQGSASIYFQENPCSAYMELSRRPLHCGIAGLSGVPHLPEKTPSSTFFAS